MFYSIGDVAKRTGIAISTLRYYDREGLFPDMERSGGGIRVFSERELATLKVIECLKTSGMSIVAIREFLHWCREGDASLTKRQNMFHERLREVERQMEELQNTMRTIQFKCWYYDTAVAAGTEAGMQDLKPEQIPEELRAYMV